MPVEPIRDVEKIKEMSRYLKYKRERDYVLWITGLNTGLRISDIVPIKYSDIFNRSGEFKDYLIINEKKTSKQKKIKLNNTLKAAVSEYVINKGMSGEDYLFYSRKGNGHITTTQAYRILKEAANDCNIENFACHSTRKSYGLFAYKASEHNIGLIMDIFNHSNPRITLRYIGIDQEQKDKLYDLVQLG